jgi:hypothetical protein
MTGLTSDHVDRLVLDVYAHASLDPARRRAVGPYRTVLVVLLYLRHNLPQALLAELFGCSQPTVSRMIGRLAPVIITVLTPTAEQVVARELRSTVRVDGFLAPTGDRRKDTYTSGMYSGKRHRCGFNIQVIGSCHGTLMLTGKPQPGAMHDAKAWHESGLAAKLEGRLHADSGPGGFADTAYTGTGLSVPHRKPERPNPDRLDPRLQPRDRLPPRQRRARHRAPQELAAAGHRLPRPAQPLPNVPRRHHETGGLPNLMIID